MGHVPRRQFIVGATALLAASLARSQQSGLPLLGILRLDRQAPEEWAKAPMNQKLKALGWIEGQNLIVEKAFADGRDERLPELAMGLVRRHVNVIYAFGPDAAVAAARATKTIPIVFWGVAYPVEQGLIKSFARPGGNVTGVAALAADGADFFAKQLQLLKEIAPAITRVAVVTNPTVNRTVSNEQRGSTEKQKSIVDSAARRLKLELQWHVVAKSEDLDSVFAAILASKAQGLHVFGSPLIASERPRIVDFANRNRLVSSLFDQAWVHAGGLFSYGLDSRETIGQAAVCVDKILRGARPADIPVEMPSKFELALNLKTAKAIGITIPPSVLVRADEVIR